MLFGVASRHVLTWRGVVAMSALVITLLAATVVGTTAKAADKPALVVAPVEVSRDFQIPSDWLANFTSHLIDLLKYSQKFPRVIAPGEDPAPDTAQTLHVTIIGFHKGNRALRYAVGFGVGREKMKATVVLDGPDGAALFSQEFASTTTMGLYGSKSGETPRKLAEKIVRALP
jgi:hypothetical protein